jgi:hypothetical protein
MWISWKSIDFSSLGNIRKLIEPILRKGAQFGQSIDWDSIGTNIVCG